MELKTYPATAWVIICVIALTLLKLKLFFGRAY